MGKKRALLIVALCAALAAAVAAVYWPASGYDFVVYDDGEHVFENPMVKNGFTREGVARAFGTLYAAYWIPLTWLSYMLDAELFGMNPGGFHVMNVAFHAANAVLLFLVLWRMTGAIWRSATVAALFALHPLRVESVAWITERKDVLSTFFFLLALASYLRYTRRRRPLWYGAVLICALLGMMVKPMLVSLPFVLLLCDWWPLERWKGGGEWREGIPWSRLILEKVPLLALSAAFALLLLYSQGTAHALLPLEENFLQVRLTLFFSSYFIYLKKFFWPAALALEGRPLTLIAPWKGIAAGLAWAGLSLLALKQARRAPWFAVGWFWYVVTLAPVSGIVQTGVQWLGDRFTYIPQIGIAIALVWLGADALGKRRHGPTVAATGAVALLLCLSLLSRGQLAHWRDSHALLTHALRVSEENFRAHLLLGETLLGEGRVDEALDHYRRGVELRPSDPFAQMNLGTALERKGSREGALEAFRRAADLAPGIYQGHMRLGAALASLGEHGEAEGHFLEAIRLGGDVADVHYNYAVALLLQGRTGAAKGELRRAVEIDRWDTKARLALATLLGREGDLDGAERLFEEVVRLDGSSFEASYYLGLIREQRADPAGAAALYRRALGISPGYRPAAEGLERIAGNGKEP